MLPTLNGRLQTRVFMLVVLGGLITLVLTPLLPGRPGYGTTFAILATVLVAGIGWELVYHGIQQFRWEKDWPTMFGLLTAVNEGALVWLLVDVGAVPGIEANSIGFGAFLIDFVVIWLVIWVWTNGPMRVPFIRWRFFGGRIV
ncbi:hypothetical protein KG112_07135 [Nocardioides sp. zg-ZUI104]|uniref:hypothetical protein n=1 Tax=Nocardioides faecalis TaxID=2803858 RepID=UPI001BCAF431|nr:hypothetical protein [Nocardioides faecalis]MBS4752581.1 hypothetical protein [Nocardioides faecalis]